MKTFVCMGLLAVLPAAVHAQLAVNFTVNTSTGHRAISPLIYGTNEPLQDADRYGSVRMGGNRLTGYNWENNASHAGDDYNHQNDSYLCLGLPAGDCALPGRAVSNFYQTARAKNQAALVTLQMAGYVAADKSGTAVTTAEVAPSARWKQVVFSKGSPFSLTPNTADNFVYMDEQVNYLVQQHGTTASGGIAGYFLDNEPGLWPTTHPRIRPAKPTSVELWTRSRDLALAVKNVDPSAQIYGGGLYGFSDYYSLQAAPDYQTEVVNGGYAWFVDYYLDKMRQASQAAGRRLLDVLDVHWYPEAVGNSRITAYWATSAADQQARLQAPRTLWQPGYRENSWIANEPTFQPYLPILPRLLQSINTYYPGTKLSISEYAYGGNDDITGGLAQADVLGIFGRYGVHNANWWKLFDQSNPNSTAAFISPAFRLYTNYDGAGSAFGSTGVTAATSDVPNTSIYAAIDGSNAQRLTLVVINKSTQAVTGSFTLTSAVPYTTGKVWSLTGSSASLVSRPDVAGLAGNQFAYTLPARSASTIELRAATPLPVTLTRFDATATPVDTELRWTTAAERDADYFELERKGEGEADFRALGRVAATNGGPQAYRFRDTAPAAGLNYYRLLMVDRDGSRTVSPVRVVRSGPEQALDFQVYPTQVAAGVLRYTLSPALAETSRGARLEVLTLTGQRVATVVTDGSAGGTMEVRTLAPGSYLVRLSGMGGTYTRRFVVL